jgi:hypothetical protein
MSRPGVTMSDPSAIATPFIAIKKWPDVVDERHRSLAEISAVIASGLQRRIPASRMNQIVTSAF